MNTNIISEKVETPKQIESYTILWCDIAIVINWKPYCHGELIGYLEIQTENCLPIPITKTGYRSQFLHREEVAEQG